MVTIDRTDFRSEVHGLSDIAVVGWLAAMAISLGATLLAGILLS